MFVRFGFTNRQALSAKRHTRIHALELVKLIRAYGGCLGASSRRRTQRAAKSLGEPQAGIDPGISEWGNPHGVNTMYFILNT